MGIEGVGPKPGSSKPSPDHEVYPYLLRHVEILRPNQVWSTDITYCRMLKGFMYLAAVIDWYSRRVLSWKVSNTGKSYLTEIPLFVVSSPGRSRTPWMPASALRPS